MSRGELHVLRPMMALTLCRKDFKSDTMKNCSLEFCVDEMTADGQVTECYNLLKQRRNGLSGLVVAPPLVSVRQGRLRPLATYCDVSGRSHILFQQHRDGEPSRLVVECGGEWSDAADAEATCAVAQRGGFLAMTKTGPLVLTPDAGGRWSASGVVSLTPEVVVKAESVGIITSQTAAISLEDVDFDRTSPQIGQTGLATLSRELTEAYSRLAALATDGGLWLQPTVVRWHLLGSSGERVYSSAPMIIGCGWQCVQPVSVDCVKGDSTLDVPVMTLSATPYRLRLSVGTDCAARLTEAGIAAVELCASPQMHPIETAATAPWRLMRQSTSEPVLTVALPGATDGFSSRDSHRADMLTRLMSMMPTAESQIAVVRLDDGACDTLLNRSGASDMESEMKDIESLLSQTVTSTVGTNVSTLLQSITSPNCFTASTVATSGNTVVWGDITPIRPSNPGVSDICAGFAVEEWNGVLEVRYRGGDCIRYDVGGSMCPTAWSAAVSYPDATAVELVLFVRRTSGVVIRGVKSLKPSPDGSRAVAVDSGLAEEPFEVWEGDMPESDAAEAVTDSRIPGVFRVLSLWRKLQLRR